MMKLRAIIVDDEPYCCEVLETLLEEIPNVEVVAVCHQGQQALDCIRKLSPDLVFLDVEMPVMNGFEMLEKLPSVDFEIIFTTSYDQYALKAIRFSAIDYLLKPIDGSELKKAIEKLMKRTGNLLSSQLEILMQKIHRPFNAVNRIALPTMEGLQMVAVSSILRCESDNNYTYVYLRGSSKLLVSRTLKDFEDLLEGHAFIRVHRCSLVNLNEVEKYVKGEGGYLVMSDGASVDVARNKKEILMKRLLPYRK